MSLFSEQLKLLLQDSGQTIYKISKNAKLDRTTIQRAMTGERLPSLSFVETLCEYLRVSPTEKAELMDYYTISKIGETNYATRKHIKTLIEQIAHLHQETRQPASPFRPADVEMDSKEITVFTGEYQVNSFVRQFLEHKALSRKPIAISVPFEYHYFFECLRPLYWASNGEWEIAHLIKLIKNQDLPSHATTNLEALSNVFPCSFCIQNGYRPSYFYQNASLVQDISIAMPYYFFTQDYCVTLAADFKTAILYHNPDIVRVYQNHFDSCLAQATPLITNITGNVDMAFSYLSAFQLGGGSTHVIEAQPCLARYYTADMVDVHVRKDVEHREEFKRATQAVFEEAQKTEKSMCSYFSVDGLHYFAETGIMANLPPQYAVPFFLEEREHFLKSMRSEIENDVILYRAINPAKFMVSPTATIEFHENRTVLFLAARENYIISSLLQEKSIGDAFFDFFQSLPDSDLVYSKENTLQLIDDCLEKIAFLKQQEKESE